jgi:FKBP-type peptidyl-prolyl cis-trans isomerase
VITRFRFCASRDSIRRYPVTLAVSLVVAHAAVAIPAYAQQGGASKDQAQQSPKSSSNAAGQPSEKAKGSYSIGVLMGAQMRQMGLTSGQISFADLERGFKDVTSGKAQPSPEDQENVRALMMHAQQAASTTNRAAARKFLAENGKREGVKTTASGLQYKVLTEGSGAAPHPTDTVTVNYRGTLLNGTEFDSSYKHGQPATFEVDRIIKGWQEALVLMKPGAKWELYVPPDLAYGDRSPGGVIPPGSLLKFEVELLKVAPTPPPSPQGALPRVSPNGGGNSGGADSGR